MRIRQKIELMSVAGLVTLGLTLAAVCYGLLSRHFKTQASADVQVAIKVVQNRVASASGLLSAVSLTQTKPSAWLAQ